MFSTRCFHLGISARAIRNSYSPRYWLGILRNKMVPDPLHLRLKHREHFDSPWPFHDRRLEMSDQALPRRLEPLLPHLSLRCPFPQSTLLEPVPPLAPLAATRILHRHYQALQWGDQSRESLLAHSSHEVQGHVTPHERYWADVHQGGVAESDKERGTTCGVCGRGRGDKWEEVPQSQSQEPDASDCTRE